MSTAAGTPSASSLKVAGSGRASSYEPYEPSPASTYGGSVSSDAGNDAPQTPHDGGAMLRKFSKLTIKVEKSGEHKVNVARYSPPFVRNGVQGRIDDPFTSPHRHASAQRTPTGPKFMNRAVISDNWRSGSSSGSPSDSSSPAAEKALRSAQSGRSVTVRDYGAENVQLQTSEQVIPIKAEDAQAHYPPSSCVFVANLVQSESDEALEVAVTQVFREYGIVFVKIRRDAKGMPFAFCQFTNDRDAARAIKEARGRSIKGRPCRCEKAKAHRLFFFERRYGKMITADEVKSLLRVFGSINCCRKPTEVEQAHYNLGEGVIVQFELYDEGQAAIQTYRNHDEFKMQSLANMGMYSPAHGRGSVNPVGRQYLDEYDIERRSIYVGNLPTDTVIEDLDRLFKIYGVIMKATLHKNESIVDATQQRCYAFVEFAAQPSVSSVLSVNISLGFALRGMVLRIAQKDTNAAVARSQRRQSGNGLGALAPASASAPVGPYQSPAPQPTARQQQVSPFVGVSPQVYGSPFSPPTGYSPYSAYFSYGGYGSPMYATATGQAAYYGTQYPALAYYTSSPTYNAGGSATSSPLGQQFYYPSYQQPYSFSPSAQQGAFPATYGQPAFNTGAPAQDDRSSTPTPLVVIPASSPWMLSRYITSVPASTRDLQHCLSF